MSQLKSVRSVFLIAAGTGVTPMLSLLKFMLSRSNPKCERAHLLFFNKTEEDILFRDNFETMAKEDNRLTVTHVLSDAKTWTGPKGRINQDLLVRVLGKSLKCNDACEHLACVCGPTEFTQTGLQLLRKCGLKDDCVHAFMG